VGYPQFPDPLRYPDPFTPAPPYDPNAVAPPLDPTAGAAAEIGEPIAPTPIKIVIAGGFGVGKTTAVGVISDSPPLTTEAAMTDVAAEIDRTGEVPEKTTTTVAIDFGTIRLDEGLKLYLFGTPGQDRFGFMWHDICLGALGALVIVDTRRLDDCYPAIDYFEQAGIPFVVAINMFYGRLKHNLDDVRWAVAANGDTPLITFDARSRSSVRDALLTVCRHALQRATAGV
jgi:signal recognition particle receptor subunit beta